MRKRSHRAHTGKESELQKGVVKWFKYQYPNALAFHCPNGMKREKIQDVKSGKWYSPDGKALKAMGVLPGVMDWLICVSKITPDGFYITGFAIELKTKTGKLSQDQKDRIEDFRKHGWLVGVINSSDDFIEKVNKYMKLSDPPKLLDETGLGI